MKAPTCTNVADLMKVGTFFNSKVDSCTLYHFIQSQKHCV